MPIVTIYTNVASNIALAVQLSAAHGGTPSTLAALEAAAAASPWWFHYLFWWRYLLTVPISNVLLLLWLGDAGLRETRALLVAGSSYLSDPNKLLEWAGQVLAMLGVFFGMVHGLVPDDTRVAFLAAGVTLLWTSQLLR